ncbi:VPDSG-CTERM sorting domain-containing protein [bacterium]|nr:VPDSG-CTERM sorting domain-containing protein [bacterium]
MKITRNLNTGFCGLTFAAAVLIAQPARAVTWTQWSSAGGGNDHWYGLTDAAESWTDARTHALSAYSGSITDLVAINSAAEQSFLVGAFGSTEWLWIGLTDQAQEGNWSVWTSGEPVTYTNWSPGEPNDYQPAGGEDYAAMNWFGAGLWNDLDSGRTLRGIIERTDRPTGVPDGGATIALFGFGLAGLAFVRRGFTSQK